VFVRAIGYRALRRYLISGERFTAEEMLRPIDSLAARS
jgi:hypothetical protein